jgi:hypothetical protein
MFEMSNRGLILGGGCLYNIFLELWFLDVGSGLLLPPFSTMFWLVTSPTLSINSMLSFVLNYGASFIGPLAVLGPLST